MSTLYYESSFRHFGIKGMKWGVRRYQNKDGSLTKAGRERLYNNTAAIVNTNFGISKATLDNVKQAGEEWKNATKLAYDFHNNKKLNDEYLRKAAAKRFKDNNMAANGWSLDDVIREYTHGDFNQGSNTAFELYCKDKGYDYDKIQTDAWHANEKMQSASRQYTNELLRIVGSTQYGPLRSSLELDTTTQLMVENKLYSELLNRGYYIDE